MIFLLKFFISMIAIYFSFRVMFVSVLGLMMDRPWPNNMNLLFFSMLFFLGLSNTVDLVEMLINKKKEHFKLLLVSTIFMFCVSIFILSL